MSLSFITTSEREDKPLADLTMFRASVFAKNQLPMDKGQVDRGNGEDDVDVKNGDDNDDDIVEKHARYNHRQFLTLS